MITTIVRFSVGGTDRETLKKVFEDSVPTYQKVPGLIRKYYLISDDGQTAGGVYLWNSRQEAEALYTDQWKAMIEGKYGSAPSVSYFESPVVLDNEYSQVKVG